MNLMWPINLSFYSHPENDCKWLFNYQDHLPLSVLASLQNKVDVELIKIFLLRSNNGHQFTESVILGSSKNVAFIHVYQQPQGSSERYNKIGKNMLRTRMYDHKMTNLSLGCYFVLHQKRNSRHKA